MTPLKHFLLQRLGRILNRQGVGAIPLHPIDLRGVVDTPIEAKYVADAHRSFVIDIPLARCRGLVPMAFRLDAHSDAHPFVQTLRAYQSGSAKQYAGSPLHSYFDTVQPTSAADVMGLSETTIFDSLPPHAACPPWSGRDPFNWRRKRIKRLREEFARQGIKPRDAVQHGWKAWGPCSVEQGEVEFNRLVTLLDAIRSKGYHRQGGKEGDIGGVVLVRGGEWNCQISGGQHRAAALSALGYAQAPIRIGGAISTLIYRDDAPAWPLVRSGIISLEQAVRVFDRIFDGILPPCANT